MSLTNEQFKALTAAYQRRRQEVLSALENRRAEVYARFPELDRIRRDLVTATAERGRAVLFGNTEELGRLDREIEQLKAEQEAAFSATGLPADYLEPHYRCPDCRDTGFINGEKCHCFKRAAAELLYDGSNIRAMLEKDSFDSLDMGLYSREPGPNGRSQYAYMADKIALCRSFVRNFDADKRSLLFHGPTGVGKTFLSNCIARELIDTGHSVVYFTAISLFDQLARETFGEDRSAEQSPVVDCDLLIIDDLGTELVNSFTAGMLFYIVNERLTHGRSTIISTNLSPQELADLYTERVSSRIVSGYDLVELYGEDLRVRIARDKL